jgi:hypothetical protein
LKRFLLPQVTALVIACAAGVAAVGTASASPGPVVTKRPTVRGQASQGSRLVATTGQWTGAGQVQLSYQWYRCDPMGRHCRALHGVSSNSHRAGPNDVGHTLSVAVKATDAKGTTRAFASLIGPIAGTRTRLDSLVQPTILGSAVEGRKIRVAAGQWSPKPSGFNFQWARCNLELRACASIGGETADTHTIALGDVGHVLVAIVQARSGVAARAVFSTATAVAVKKGAQAGGPTLETAPAIAEVLQEGHELTGSSGTWSGSGAVNLTYNWYRCDTAGAHCKVIGGARSTTYLEAAKDVGQTLGFAVHATDESGTTTAYAPLLGPVAASSATLFSTAIPVLAGTPAAGQTLQVSGGGWSEQPSALAYQWQRCNRNGRLCTPISGATASSYAAVADDSGHRLIAVVQATAGTATQDAFSTASPLIVSAPPPPAAPSASAGPTVAGTIEQGSQLTGSAGTGSFTYNWFRCDAAGAHCLSIHGATKPTYTEGAKDVGHTLGFAVHATDSAGTTPPRTPRSSARWRLPMRRSHRPRSRRSAARRRWDRRSRSPRAPGARSRRRSPTSGSGATRTAGSARRSTERPVRATRQRRPTRARRWLPSSPERSARPTRPP